MGRELSGEGDDVEQFKQSKRRTRLGLVDCCWKPFTSNKLLPVRDFLLITTTEIHGDMMQTIGV